jgi:hypothetical protein
VAKPGIKREKCTSIRYKGKITRDRMERTAGTISANKNAPRLAVFQHFHPLEHVPNALAISSECWICNRERIASSSPLDHGPRNAICARRGGEQVVQCALTEWICFLSSSTSRVINLNNENVDTLGEVKRNDKHFKHGERTAKRCGAPSVTPSRALI